MTDDLRATLEAAVATADQAAAASPPPAPAPAPAAPAPAPATTIETKAGEYKGNEGTEESGTKSTGVDPGTETNTEQNSVEKTEFEKKPVIQTHKPPQSWKPSAKAKWDTIDPEVRQDIVRRERDVERTLSETARERKFAKDFQEAVRPFAPRFQAANVNPIQAVRSLMYVDQVLSSAPAAQRATTMAKMIKDYGIDLSLLDSALAGENVAETDPQSVIDRIVSEKMKPFQEWQQTQQQAALRHQQMTMEQSAQAVEAMSSDPKFPHFDLVRDDMADYIELQERKGIPVTLEQAYNRAVAMNDDAQKAVQESAKQQKDQNANSAAQRALGASLSVGGNPASLRTVVPATDLRGTLEAAVAAHAGR